MEKGKEHMWDSE